MEISSVAGCGRYPTKRGNQVATANCKRYRHTQRHLTQASVTATAQTAPQHSHTSFHHGITFTSYETNSFSLKFNTSGVRLLVDPWLVGELVMLDQRWMYRGRKYKINVTMKVDVDQLAAETDVLVLSQDVDDHCHIPTLKALPKTLHVVASPGAAARIQPLGFKHVEVVDHGQTVTVCNGKVSITAAAGALVGPPWVKRQNNFLFTETGPQPVRVYYDPHCDFDASSVAKLGKVDVAITCVKSTLLGAGPVAMPLLMGDINLVQLMKILQPRVLLPLQNQEIDHEGPLAMLMIERGTYEDIQKRLQVAGLSTRVEFPAPAGEAMALAL